MAEYRQRKAHATQKKQKKKKKKTAEDSEGDSQGRVEVEPDESVGGEEVSGGGRDASREGNKDPPTTEFTFARTLRSGETVKHDQTYTIEVDTCTYFSHFTTLEVIIRDISTLKNPSFNKYISSFYSLMLLDKMYELGFSSTKKKKNILIVKMGCS